MLPKMELGPVGRAELRVFALLFPCTAPEHPHMHLSFLQGSGMKGCAATSETAAALKLLLIFILFYFIFYFFFPRHLQSSEAFPAWRAVPHAAPQPFIRPDETPPSFPYLLRPSFVIFFFFLFT